MKRFLFLILIGAVSFSLVPAHAGNPDRVGQAGATELLINPWARSAGWNGANMASMIGVESMRFNPAGVIGIPNTEFLFSRTNWLSGADIYINSFGFVQLVGKEKTGAIGVSIMSFDFGDIEITTVDQPEGGLGTYSPQFVNIGISYAHKFSDRIRTGITFRYISEAIPDANATGFCLDAGLQYLTDLGGDEDLKRTSIGISLRNVGTPMRFGGDGLKGRGSYEGSDISMSLSTPADRFELPTLVNISLNQDFYFDAERFHKLTAAFMFTSNSFSHDQFLLGAQYSLKNIIMLRGGMLYEDGLYDKNESMSVFKGPTAGFSVNVPFGKKKNNTFGIDYSYRATYHFSGVHQFGARLIL
jgi:hypothetical protein